MLQVGKLSSRALALLFGPRGFNLRSNDGPAGFGSDLGSLLKNTKENRVQAAQKQQWMVDARGCSDSFRTRIMRIMVR